ncbi:hypothetical protein SmJEL517_g01421 [Synchytrium microbalum]|uniref:BTB domain-containing protein n=1 Tax=Synchytrium microbalum TaxID=1806994 RepID=A0A507CFK5_9FUNG|nr:uncharacterized protein SmJEL517_g01421 [Synchytrium microbalum]TPX36293.1 hypothetical protein SmJEL517_g01421 [Synchytrium microbalum]
MAPGPREAPWQTEARSKDRLVGARPAPSNFDVEGYEHIKDLASHVAPPHHTNERKWDLVFRKSLSVPSQQHQDPQQYQYQTPPASPRPKSLWPSSLAKRSSNSKRGSIEGQYAGAPVLIVEPPHDDQVPVESQYRITARTNHDLYTVIPSGGDANTTIHSSPYGVISTRDVDPTADHPTLNQQASDLTLNNNASPWPENTEHQHQTPELSLNDTPSLSPKRNERKHKPWQLFGSKNHEPVAAPVDTDSSEVSQVRFDSTPTPSETREAAATAAASSSPRKGNSRSRALEREMARAARGNEDSAFLPQSFLSKRLQRKMPKENLKDEPVVNATNMEQLPPIASPYPIASNVPTKNALDLSPRSSLRNSSANAKRKSINKSLGIESPHPPLPVLPNKHVFSDPQRTALTALVDTYISPLTALETDILVESHLSHFPPPPGETLDSYRDALKAFASMSASELGAVEGISRVLVGGPAGSKREYDRVLVSRLLSTLANPLALWSILPNKLVPKDMRWKPFASFSRNIREEVVIGMTASKTRWVQEALLLVSSLTYNIVYSKAQMPGQQQQQQQQQQMQHQEQPSTTETTDTNIVVDTSKNPAWRTMGYEGPVVEWERRHVQSGGGGFRFIDVEAWGEVQRRRASFLYAGGGFVQGWGLKRKPIEFECDVIVIGSGAGGAVVAAEVSKAGYKVIVVEKGMYVTPSRAAAANVDLEVEMFEGDNLMHSEDLKTTVLTGSTWGGSAMVGWNACAAPPAEILSTWAKAFNLPKLETESFQGSLSYIQSRVQAATKTPAPRSASEILKNGATTLDYSASPIPISEHGHDPGSFLKEAGDFGAIFMEGVRATRINRSRPHGKATGIEGVLITSGTRIKITASIVVAAAGALATPRLLQASGLRNPNIGNNLALHPSTLVLATSMNQVVERVDALSYECTESPSISITTPSLSPSVLARMTPFVSGFHHKLIMARYRHLVPLMVTSTSRHVPHLNATKNTNCPKLIAPITPSETTHLVKGALVASALAVGAGANRVWSMQSGVEEYKVSPNDKSNLTRGPFWEWQSQVNRAGLGPVISTAQSGTCRMAGSDDMGAVNPDGEAFEAVNLFVADASLLPTPPGVPPMLTTWTLSHMVAQHVVERLGHLGVMKEVDLEEAGMVRNRIVVQTASKLAIRTLQRAGPRISSSLCVEAPSIELQQKRYASWSSINDNYTTRRSKRKELTSGSSNQASSTDGVQSDEHPIPTFVDFKPHGELTEDVGNKSTYPYYISQATINTLRALIGSQLSPYGAGNPKCLVLSCPHVGAGKYLDATIRAVAREQHAHVVVIDYPSVVRGVKLVQKAKKPQQQQQQQQQQPWNSFATFPISKSFSPSNFEPVNSNVVASDEDGANDDDDIDLYEEFEDAYDEDDRKNVTNLAREFQRSMPVRLNLTVRPDQSIVLAEPGRNDIVLSFQQTPPPSDGRTTSSSSPPSSSPLAYYAHDLSQLEIQQSVRELGNFLVATSRASPNNNIIINIRDLSDALQYGGNSGQYFVQSVLDMMTALSPHLPIVLVGSCHPSIFEAGNLSKDAAFYHLLFDGGATPKDSSIPSTAAARSQCGGLNLWHDNQLFASPIDQALDSFTRIDVPPPYSRLFAPESHAEMEVALDKWLSRMELDMRREVAETNWTSIRMSCLSRGVEFSDGASVTPPGRESHRLRVNKPILEQYVWPLEKIDRLVALAVGQSVTGSTQRSRDTPIVLSHHHFIKALTLIQDGDVSQIANERFGETEQTDDKLLPTTTNPKGGRGGAGSNTVVVENTAVNRTPVSGIPPATATTQAYQQQSTAAKTTKDESSRGLKSTLQYLKSRGHEVSAYEKKMLSTVIDPTSISVTFADLVLPAPTKLALQTLVTLPLLRPDHFATGILSQHGHNGVLLFGPPGTGKTLLAKAVAKASGARFMALALSDIFDKYVGEGEKHIRAAFSLARKLAPVVIFIDEIDGIFSARRGDGWNASRREIINEAMSEWDGLNSDNKGVIVMGATNRPFDLDDAVLRRMPRRILVDLPTEAQRASILQLHLAKENLDSSVSITDLAKRTNMYSGSDLKNLAVAAALSSVKESVMREMLGPEGADMPRAEVLSKLDSMEGYNESLMTVANTAGAASTSERVIHIEHFEKAFSEISASISDDTQSLVELKKWEQQFAKNGIKVPKSGYGFSFNSNTIKLPSRKVVEEPLADEISKYKEIVVTDLIIKIDGAQVERNVHKLILLGQIEARNRLSDYCIDACSLEHQDTITLKPETTETELDYLIKAAYNFGFDFPEGWGLQDVFESEALSDVTITVLDHNDNIYELPAHRLIITTRIPFCRALFSSPWADSSSSVIKLDETCVTAFTLPFILKYAYGIPLELPTTSAELQAIYSGADYLGMTGLCSRIISTLYTHTTDTEILRLARWAKDVNQPDIINDCEKVMIENFEAVCKWSKTTFWTLSSDTELRSAVIRAVVDGITVTNCVSYLGMAVRIPKSISGKSQREAMNIRDACDLIRTRAKDTIVASFPEVCEKSSYLVRLVGGAGFGAEYVEETLKAVTASLKETNVISHIQTIQRLRERSFASSGRSDVRDMVEEAYNQCIQYATRRWISLKQKGAFVEPETLLQDDHLIRNGTGRILGEETRGIRPVLLDADRTQRPATAPVASPTRSGIVIGSRVLVAGRSGGPGVVKFIGTPRRGLGEFLGIELDEAREGRGGDGSIDGVRVKPAAPPSPTASSQKNMSLRDLRGHGPYEPSREIGQDGAGSRMGSDGNLRGSLTRGQGKTLGSIVSDFGKKLSSRNLGESMRNVSSPKTAEPELKSAVSLPRIAPSTPTAATPEPKEDEETQPLARRESLSKKLRARPTKVDLKLRNILRVDSQDSMTDLTNAGPLEKSLNFERRSEQLRSILKARPAKSELHDMNILRGGESDINLFHEQERNRRQSLQDVLEGKLTNRPRIDEIDAKILNFAETVEVLPTFRKSEYNRKPDGNATFRKLTPQLKVQIREELNQFKKNEMPVHENSRPNTCFH